jgi:signal peptidase I
MFYFSAVEGCSMQPIINKQIANNNNNNNINSKRHKDFVFIKRPTCFINLHLIASSQSVQQIEKIIQRGDVVSLISPKNVKECFIKRVIGLPGDIVKTIRYKEKYVRVPEGHCWIEGDNYSSSYDSNSFGCIPMALLIGQAKFIIFPIENISEIKTELPEHRCLKRIKVNKKGIENTVNLIDLKTKYKVKKTDNLLKEQVEIISDEIFSDDDEDDNNLEIEDEIIE